MKGRLRKKGKKVIVRTGMVIGITTVFCFVGTLVVTGACIAGMAERFGRAPMGPPQ